MRRCSVLNCNYTSETKSKLIRFFELPMNNKLAQKWLAFCGDPNLKYRKGTYVCSEHFRPEDIGMCRLKPNAVPCINSETTKKNSKRSTKQSKSNSIEDDLFASLKSKRESSDLESNDDTEETEITVEPNKYDHMLDTESSEAVIDELSNQVKDLRMENVRLKVNMQLAQKKYKAEINKLTKELQEANSHILILEMQQEYAMK
ncbi:PREDICTED: THAP domain-containing protein 3-like [Drosophila arizonae]|uniref:THAP domain-containing protein 3-like n=1 Tax=Drosophila arizonae TaxID=7263 RepID=A0ABM1NSI7_DROAR|nr:PREDICTED: THAP domain-containing protein 3-like [Drosophila arizonae]